MHNCAENKNITDTRNKTNAANYIEIIPCYSRYLCERWNNLLKIFQPIEHFLTLPDSL